MPWTFVHPAAVLPLPSPSSDRWRYALLFALLAGSAILGVLLANQMYGTTNGAVRFVRVIMDTQ